METKTLYQYIVADPAICHGEPTFCGTRIIVHDTVLANAPKENDGVFKAPRIV